MNLTCEKSNIQKHEWYQMIQDIYLEQFRDSEGFIWCCDCIVEDCFFRRIDKSMEYCRWYMRNHDGVDTDGM